MGQAEGNAFWCKLYCFDSVDCNGGIDLVFVLDDSGSICDNDPAFVYGRDSTCNNWQFITQFASNIISGMTIGTSNTLVGLVQFDSSAIVRWTLTTYVFSNYYTFQQMNLFIIDHLFA